MTPHIENHFQHLRAVHGAASLERVEAMLAGRGPARHPLQKGAKWILPGLSSTPWLDPYGFPELAGKVRLLEGLHGAIKQEINERIDAGGAGLTPYAHYLISQRDWQALYLHRDGAYQEQNRALCPTAWDFMRDDLGDWLCPLLEMHFSVLQPGAAIAPHCDLWNFSLNLHFAVDIPPDCAITVAHEMRSWEEGKCLLFDYSFVHEAWNRSDRRRICLLADVWHPDLSMAERSALTCVITEVRQLMAAA